MGTGLAVKAGKLLRRGGCALPLPRSGALRALPRPGLAFRACSYRFEKRPRDFDRSITTSVLRVYREGVLGLRDDGGAFGLPSIISLFESQTSRPRVIFLPVSSNMSKIIVFAGTCSE